MARFVEVETTVKSADRRWVNLDHVTEIYHDPQRNLWSVVLRDGRVLVPSFPDQLEGMLDAVHQDGT